MKKEPSVDIIPFCPAQTGTVTNLILTIQREEFGIPITAEDQPDLADIQGVYQKGTGNFWAGQQGIREVYLGTTPKFLAAHRFYEKNGFKEIGKPALPEAFPIMTVDTKFYRYPV